MKNLMETLNEKSAVMSHDRNALLLFKTKLKR